jgi:catechol 2,3-dioxygenase-like lactoylglutathione lyase family enzyme
VLGDAKGFHVNVNCRDLERSRGFYEAIGLRAATRTAPVAVQPGDAFGLAQAQWDAWILAGANGFDAGVVDLLEWHTPAPAGSPPANLHTQGFQRVGILVPDLDAAVRAVVANGGEIWGAPKAHGDVRLVLGNDPDGVAIELVQAGGPTTSFVGVACSDLERSVAWYRSIGFREAARFASANDDSSHLRIDGPSVFDEVMMTAPGGGLSLILVGFTTPGVAAATPRPANAVGIWRVAFLVSDIDAECRELEALGIELLSQPVSMAMGPGLPELRFVCLRGPDHEVIELIEQPT